jgi:hypothetical protein
MTRRKVYKLIECFSFCAFAKYFAETRQTLLRLCKEYCCGVIS